MVIIGGALSALFIFAPFEQNMVARIIIAVILFLLILFFTLLSFRWVRKRIHWYEKLVDAIPFPISVTDMNMKWTFINKPVEDFLGIKRADVLGKHCSNWGAGICNTENCGIDCLRKGNEQTFFNQHGRDFQVDVHYIHDANGKRVGHIEVVQDISRMTETLKKQASLIEKVDIASKAFVSASYNISAESQTLAQGTTEQSTTIDQLSASIRDVLQQTMENAEMANKAVELAQEIIRNAEQGSQQMARMTQAVEEISDASSAISNVIKDIDDIAFQTNILSLNAAVEAARAGSHGKGFGVVADEVRSLASKSAESARNTAELIDRSIQKATIGVTISEETAASLDKIVASINESVTLIKNIAQASDAQTNTITFINSGIIEVEQVVRRNSTTAEQNAAIAEEMSSQSSILHSLIEDYTSKDDNSLQT